MIGKTIGKYRFVAPLGRGGMGTVFRAVDETLDREVAIKVLNPDLADSEVMKRFRAEAITLAKLSHPDIATIYELYRADADLLMVMELLRGETLDKLSERCSPLPLDQAVSIVNRLLGALEHAHRVGIVHRDLKPANVMVTQHGGVKIMDFGVARVIGADRGTKDGFLIGTPSYMSPEQVLGHDLDGRADLYSVGVMFYQLLTGSLPFMADTVIAMAQKQVLDPPASLHLYREGLPEWCEDVIHRALEKSPAKRFQTAEEFRAELARAMGISTNEHAIFKAHPVPSIERTVLQAGAGPTVVLPKKHLALPGLAPTAAAIAVCLPVIFALSSAPSTPATLPPSPLPALLAVNGRLAMLPEPVVEQVTRRTMSVKPAGQPASVPNVVDGPTLLPPLVFDARTLVNDGDRHRERRAKVLLADGMVTITAGDEMLPLQKVPYDRLIAVTYSRGKDPQRNSPSGPVPIARVKAGKFGFLKGVRHWIALRTSDRYIVLGVDEEQVQPVLGALEQRTGHRPERIIDREEAKQPAGPVPSTPSRIFSKH
jgi:serine/threonine protein kinase